MSVTEQLLAAVDASGADAGKRAVVEEFIQNVGPIVETLGPSIFQEVMASAAAGQVPGEIVESLNAQQVAALLTLAEGDLATLAGHHGAEIAAWNAAIGQFESAALAAVARVLIGMI